MGGAPAGVDGAVIAAGMLGGALGGLALGAMRGKRGQDGPVGRAMTLTSQRVLLFERGELSGELPLEDVKKAKVKGSRANGAWRVLEISADDGRKLVIEGARQDIKGFAAALPKFGA